MATTQSSGPCSTRSTGVFLTWPRTAAAPDRDPRIGAMSTPVAVFLSFRLGGADGVSVEAKKWEWALSELGFATRRVAGGLVDGLRPDDTWLAFLPLDPGPGAIVGPGALAASLSRADLVAVEDL